LPRDIVCLRNISINTLHKGDDDDDDDNDNKNNDYTPRNNPEELSSYQRRSGSLKSRKVTVYLFLQVHQRYPQANG